MLKDLLSNNYDDVMFHYYGGKTVEIILSLERTEISLGFFSVKHVQKTWRENLKNLPTPCFRKKHIHRKGYWYEFK